jgi:hypothetical protein
LTNSHKKHLALAMGHGFSASSWRIILMTNWNWGGYDPAKRGMTPRLPGVFASGVIRVIQVQTPTDLADSKIFVALLDIMINITIK